MSGRGQSRSFAGGAGSIPRGTYVEPGDLRVDVRNYGAIADGAHHPLSERYATLAAAQAVYSFVTDLAHGIDWAATVKAANVVIAAGGGELALTGAGTFFIERPVQIKCSNLKLSIEANVVTPLSADCFTFELGDQAHFAMDGVLTWRTMTGTPSIGDTSITLATPAQASDFAVGDYAYVRAQNTVAGTNFTPIAEILKVSAVNTTTGVVSFAWPLTKDYRNVADNSGATHIFGLAKCTSLITENIEVTGGGRIRNDARRPFTAYNVVGFRMHHLTIEGRGSITPRGRNLDLHHLTVNIVPNWTAGASGVWRPYFPSFDTGTSEASFTDSVCTSTGVGFVHIHEGLGNCTVDNVTMEVGKTDASSTEDWPVVSIRAGSFGTRVGRVRIVNNPRYYCVIALESQRYNTTATPLGHRDLVMDDITVAGTIASSGTGQAAVYVSPNCNNAMLRGVRVPATLTGGQKALQVDGSGYTVSDCWTPAGMAAIARGHKVSNCFGTTSSPYSSVMTGVDLAFANTTKADVPGLSIPVAAGESWIFEFFLTYDAALNNDISTAFTFPTGTTLRAVALAATAAGTSVVASPNWTAVVQVNTFDGGGGRGAGATATKMMMFIKGKLDVGNTGGTVQLQAAKRSNTDTTSPADDTTVYLDGSGVVATRIAG